MTSPISDDDLLEALYRADKFLNGDSNRKSGHLYVCSDAHTVDIFYGTNHAFSFLKGSEALDMVMDILPYCNWSPSGLDRALVCLRGLMVLDDLAEL